MVHPPVKKSRFMSAPAWMARYVIRVIALALLLFMTLHSLRTQIKTGDNRSLPSTSSFQSTSILSNFEEVNAGLPPSRKAYWGDYDDDGDLDILLLGGPEGNAVTSSRIYNNTAGAFSDIGDSLPRGDQAEWGDFDNDGDLDIVIGGPTQPNNLNCFTTILRNDSGNFNAINASLLGVQGLVSWVDYDNDEDLDLLVSGHSPDDHTQIARLYKNTSGVFTEIPTNLPGVTYGDIAWADMENDGDLDAAISGIDNVRLTRIYRNNNGNLNLFLELEGVRSSTVAWGDYDQDGYPDLFVGGECDTAPYWVASIYRSVYGYAFVNIHAPLAGISNGAAEWGDFNFDGYLDLAYSGGQLGGAKNLYIYYNDFGTFPPTPQSLSGLWYSSTEWGDFDGNKSLDLLVAGTTGNSPNGNFTTKIYRNTMQRPGNVFSLTTETQMGAIKRVPDQPWYVAGANVVLTAVSTSRYQFSGWGGDILPSENTGNPITITMNSDRTITANYRRFFILHTSATNGIILKNPPLDYLEEGTAVVLTAKPDTGYLFTGWSGDVPGDSLLVNPLPVSMYSDKNIVANFTLNPNNTFLTLNAANGTISKYPNRAWHFPDEAVTLIATPSEGYLFSHWSGEISEGDSLQNPFV
ncbi:MAG: VCBS repeat-containing protein, partial [Bacteroidetes bacterium]